MTFKLITPLWARPVMLYIEVKDGPWALGLGAEVFYDKIIKFLKFNYFILLITNFLNG